MITSIRFLRSAPSRAALNTCFPWRFLALLPILLCIASGRAQTNRVLDIYPVNLQAPTQSSVTAAHLLAAGEYLYVSGKTNNEAGVFVIDMKDPRYPLVIGQHLIGGSRDIWGMELVGSFLYLSGERITVLNVSNPAEPVLMGHATTTARVDRFAVDASLLYAAGNGGLEVLDISNPATPEPLKWLPLPGESPAHIQLTGHIAYVTGHTNFHVIDISDRRNPQVISTRNLGEPGISWGFSYDMAIYKDHLYLSGYNKVAFIFDLADPAEPRLLTVASLATILPIGFDHMVYSVEATDDLLFVSRKGGGVTAVDISNPASPYHAGSYLPSYQSVSSVSSMARSGDLLYCLLNSNLSSLQVLRWQEAPVPSSSLRVAAGSTTRLAYADGFMHVAGQRIITLNMEDFPGGAPFTNSTLTSAYQIEIRGQNLFVLDDRFLRVFDIDPTGALSARGSLSNSVFSSITGPSAFLDSILVVPRNGLTLFDISDPQEPEILGVNNAWSGANGLSGEGTLLSLRQAGVAKLIDFADPKNPIEITALTSITNAASTHIQGELLFVSHGMDISIYDIAEPSQPKFLSKIHTRSQQGRLKLFGGMLFIDHRWNGYEVFDLHVPTAPRRVGGRSISILDLEPYEGGFAYYGGAASLYSVSLPLRQEEWMLGLLFQNPDFFIELDPPAPERATLEQSADLQQWEEFVPVSAGAVRLELPMSEYPAPSRYFRLRQN